MTDYEDRKPDGTFRPGASGNPGGRPKGTARLLRDMIDDRVSDIDWNSIIDTAKAFAKAGDPIAREWLSSRKEGKAPQAIMVSTEERAEIVLTWPNTHDESTPALSAQDTPTSSTAPALPANAPTFDPLAMIDQQTIEAVKRRYPGNEGSEA